MKICGRSCISVDGTWDEAAEQIAECYEQAGLNDVAKIC